MSRDPGIYDLSNVDYHADDALSSSGARKLLPPSCPALFRYEREHGEPPKAHFDFGSAAHALILGHGQDQIEVVVADSWRTNAAKAAKDEAHEQGRYPILSKDFDVVLEMAAAIRAHPLALALLTESPGKPERSLFWVDERTGVPCRARLDWLPEYDERDGRLIIPDYKTAASADPDKWARSAADYGYHQQDTWYTAGVRALGVADAVAFVFIVQEKTPPYLVNVIELDANAKRIGYRLNETALDIFARCTETGRWPGYGEDVVLQSLPTYYEIKHAEEASL